MWGITKVYDMMSQKEGKMEWREALFKYFATGNF